MKKIKVLAIAMFTVFSFSQANAGILFEPVLGYNLSGEAGATDIDSGMAFGARVGWQNLGLMFGLDYQSVSGELDDSTSTDYDSTEIGLFVGYDFPVMIRVWAAYMLSGSFEPGAGSKYEGISGTKIGVGFTFLPLVSVNIEMKAFSYDEWNGASADLDYEVTMLSVSLPLTF